MNIQQLILMMWKLKFDNVPFNIFWINNVVKLICERDKGRFITFKIRKILVNNSAKISNNNAISISSAKT